MDGLVMVARCVWMVLVAGWDPVSCLINFGFSHLVNRCSYFLCLACCLVLNLSALPCYCLHYAFIFPHLLSTLCVLTLALFYSSPYCLIMTAPSVVRIKRNIVAMARCCSVKMKMEMLDLRNYRSTACGVDGATTSRFSLPLLSALSKFF